MMISLFSSSIYKISDFTVDGHRKLKGYNTGAYTIEFVGREYPEPETPDQKFNRLQMEILELKEELQDGGVRFTFLKLILLLF